MKVELAYVSRYILVCHSKFLKQSQIKIRLWNVILETMVLYLVLDIGIGLMHRTYRYQISMFCCYPSDSLKLLQHSLLEGTNLASYRWYTGLPSAHSRKWAIGQSYINQEMTQIVAERAVKASMWCVSHDTCD